MRFYSRVTVALCLNPIMGAISMILGFASRRHGGLLKVNGIFIFFLFLIAILTHFSTYWEIRPDGLCVRRLWRMRTIPFDQIASVKSEGPGDKPALNWLKVFYKSPFPFLDTDQNANDRGTLLLVPGPPVRAPHRPASCRPAGLLRIPLGEPAFP